VSQHEPTPFGVASRSGGGADPPPCPCCDGTAFDHLFRKAAHDFVRCRACGLVRLDPLPDPAALAAVYERSYADGLYATFAEATDVRTAIAAARLAAIRGRVPAGPWLDIGAATGTFVGLARAAGLDAEGIEQAAVAVEAARAQGLPVVRAAVEEFVPARRYACVTAFDVLEHLLDPGAFLARLRDWLAPGGRLVLTVPDVRSAAARLLGRRWYYYAPPVHVYYFHAGTLARLLERHGFVVVATRVAPKRLTLDYVLAVLPAFEPRLTTPGRVVRRLVPRALRARPVAVPTGELMVLAVPSAPA
jgi:SAM-dependent methyltransferase